MQYSQKSTLVFGGTALKKDSRTWGERIVDNIMDKLADKISAAEMIKANAAAEAAETQRLRTQALQYQEEMEAIHKTADELTALMNKISSKLDDNTKDTDNAENKKLLENISQNINEGNKKLLESLSGGFEDSNRALLDALGRGIEDNNKNLYDAFNSGIEDKNKAFIESLYKRLDEEHKYTHDIGVQVYRNVQASSQDENKKLTEDIIKRILEENDHLAVSVADETSGQLQRAFEGLSEKQKELSHKIEELQLAIDKNHACTTVSVITLIAVLIGIGINVLNIMGILHF